MNHVTSRFHCEGARPATKDKEAPWDALLNRLVKLSQTPVPVERSLSPPTNP